MPLYQKIHINADSNLLQILEFARRIREEIRQEVYVRRFSSLELLEYQNTQTGARLFMMERDAESRPGWERI